jgi:hypothetical protein
MNNCFLIINIWKKIFNKLGYEIRRFDPNRTSLALDNSKGFILYRYLKEDGSFDYEAYKRIQTEANKSKINNVWVREENISFLSNYIKELIGVPEFGICHGTRRGKEQEWFRKYLNCEVIGTEISDTAKHFPHTIKWDFHDAKAEWIDAVDFIYSNSFDHSYDPEKCLNVWMSCVKKGGICILEHSDLHSPKGSSGKDPFGANIIQMPYLILTWGKGKYGIREILKAPSKHEKLNYLYFIVIQRF